MFSRLWNLRPYDFPLLDNSCSYLQSSPPNTQTAATAAKKIDTAIANEWAFHNNRLGVKTQVAAQCGDDSPQLQALGLRRKSDYKTPAKKKVKV